MLQNHLEIQHVTIGDYQIEQQEKDWNEDRIIFLSFKRKFNKIFKLDEFFGESDVQPLESKYALQLKIDKIVPYLTNQVFIIL